MDSRIHYSLNLWYFCHLVLHFARDTKSGAVVAVTVAICFLHRPGCRRGFARRPLRRPGSRRGLSPGISPGFSSSPGKSPGFYLSPGMSPGKFSIVKST